ncbi:hypothetical protein LXA43DRAFT_1051502 [Ganoderma leucocontextum]|nr:hypothetical protein LXA43DRAFT_1051502 [Ganoderma leucocontextum]
MPAIRDHTEPGVDSGGTRRQYSNGLAQLKAEFRGGVTTKLRLVSGKPKAKMGWSEKGYALGVVVRCKQNLLGWPWYANIPFANPSDIVGGQPVLCFLLSLWHAGILRFETASDEDIDLARRNARAVLPGAPPTRPPPFCWGPFGRNDIGLGRLRPVTNPLGLPLRHPRNGPKTPKLILDSDVEDSDVVDSESEGAY